MTDSRARDRSMVTSKLFGDVYSQDLNGLDTISLLVHALLHN